MYTTFLLFFFQIFKVYSRLVSSSSVAGLCLFAKGEVKNLSKAAYVIRRLTSRSLERKQPSRVGVSPLCDVVSLFLCHTHTDGKDKLLEWPDRSCLLLYVSERIHLKHSLAETIFVSRVRKTTKKSSLVEKFVSRVTR